MGTLSAAEGVARDRQALRMRQLGLGINAQQLVHAADEVARIDRAFLDRFAFGVRSADDLAAFEAAAGDHGGEHLAMMTASAVPGRFPLDFGRSAKFAAPPDNGAVQQAVLRQILQQRGHAFVHFRQAPAHGLEILLVRVPAAVVVDGDVRDAALDQPARHQAGLPEGVAAVTLSQLVLLLREIEHLARVAQDQVVGLLLALLGGGQLRIARHGVLQRVELVEQLAPVLLPLVGDARRDHAFHREPALAGSPPVAKGL